MKLKTRHSDGNVAVAAGLGTLRVLRERSQAGPQPAGDPVVQQLQLAESATREAKLEGDKKPPREVRKSDSDARKSGKKEPTKPQEGDQQRR